MRTGRRRLGARTRATADPSDRRRRAQAAAFARDSEYIELHATSAFSFLAGATLPEQLIQRAVELEMPAIALADRNGVYGAARFHTAAQPCG
jgi:DNA polymerase III alpha subunit (gram-positive type)